MAIRSHLDGEAALPEPGVHMALQLQNFTVQNRGQGLVIQRVIRNHRIEAVDELRRELAPDGGQRHIFELTTNVRRQIFRPRLEAEIGPNLLENLSCSQVACEEYNRVFKIYGRIVAQMQSGFVEDAE